MNTQNPRFCPPSVAPLIVAALLLVPLAALHAADPRPGATASVPLRPNIVLILADDLGYGDVGCYGGTMVPTPNIDRLAAGGVRCTDGYVTAPVCAPSRIGLLSGVHPQRFGVHRNDDYFPSSQAGWRNVEFHRLLPETLCAAGYVTGHIGKWHTLWDARKVFDRVDDLTPGANYFPSADGSYVGVDGVPVDKKQCPEGVWVCDKPGKEYLTDRMGRHAVEFINRHGGKERPFFLYLSFTAPHSPYQAKTSHRERFGHLKPEPLNFYAAMVASLDENIGRVLDTLSSAGLRDNTLVVFASDNGPAPPLRDGWKPEWPADLTVGSAGPLSGRKAQFLEGGIRVPFIIRWPAGLKPGVYAPPVSTLDLYPTLCAVAGATIPETMKLDGVNLLPHLLGEKAGDPHERLFWGQLDKTGGDKILGAVREGNWKLVIQHWKPKLQLFDLAADPGEKHDIAAKSPERVNALHQAWQDWSRTLAPPASGVVKPGKSKTGKAK